MAGLKSFLYGAAPILGVTGAILYERQRALVNLGVLTAIPGRGPGSGVPLTAENAAAVIISVLAAGSLSDVDEDVVALCKAQPKDVSSYERNRGRTEKPTFRSEVARVLSGQKIRASNAPHSYFRGIRVSRCWRGQITESTRSVDYFVDEHERHPASWLISITAEIETDMLDRLVLYTKGALSQLEETDGDDE